MAIGTKIADAPLKANIDGTEMIPIDGNGDYHILVQQIIDASTGASAFTELNDTPDNYVGAAGMAVVVKADGSGLEFMTNVKVHNDLTGRDAVDAHPPEAITGLVARLDLMDTNIASKANTADVFLTGDFIDVTVGAGDAGKPIVLDANGMVDISMQYTTMLHFIGNTDPSDGTEYPDNTGETTGATWIIHAIANPTTGDEYTFTTGVLAGKTARLGDFMIYNEGTTEWFLYTPRVATDMVYMLDGSQALTADFQAGGFALKNIAESDVDTDAAQVGVVKTKLNKSGGEMTGRLRVEFTGYGIELFDPTGVGNTGILALDGGGTRWQLEMPTGADLFLSNKVSGGNVDIGTDGGTVMADGSVIWTAGNAPGANIPINTGAGTLFLADDGIYKDVGGGGSSPWVPVTGGIKYEDRVQIGDVAIGTQQLLVTAPDAGDDATYSTISSFYYEGMKGRFIIESAHGNEGLVGSEEAQLYMVAAHGHNSIFTITVTPGPESNHSSITTLAGRAGDGDYFDAFVVNAAGNISGAAIGVGSAPVLGGALFQVFGEISAENITVDNIVLDNDSYNSSVALYTTVDDRLEFKAEVLGVGSIPVDFSLLAPSGSLRLNDTGKLDYTPTDESVERTIAIIQSLTDNVGIDFENPTHKLEVGGDIKAHGRLLATGNIRSDNKVKGKDFVVTGSGGFSLVDKIDAIEQALNDIHTRLTNCGC